MNTPDDSSDTLFREGESARKQHRRGNMLELRQRFPELPLPKRDSNRVKKARRRDVERYGNPYPKHDEKTTSEMLQEDIEARQRRIRSIAGLEQASPSTISNTASSDVLAPASEHEQLIMELIRTYATNGHIDTDLLWEECSQDPRLRTLKINMHRTPREYAIITGFP
jgi:uncharacterized protein involved in copper resistance